MTKTKSQRKRILLIAAILAVAGLGIWYAVAAKSPTAKKASTTATKQDVAKATEADELKKPTATTNASGDTTSQAVTTANFTIVVNRPVNNDTISLDGGIEFRSTISGASSGSCTLNLTGPSGQKITKSASLMAQTSYSSCSIDVPSSELVVGSWTLSFTAKSGDVTSSPVVQKVTVQ